MEFLQALFLVIDINIDPNIGDIGPFTLAWHGVFTAVGIVAGVSLSVWLAKRDGIPSEIGQEIALVGVPCAIVGARLFYVAEHWGDFENNIPGILLDINEGGITLYGGLIGGALGGVIYGIIRKLPIAIGLDAAAPGMILGQGIGRIGDLINGEHLATESSLPWAVRYTHPETLGEFGVAVHPTAGGYELLGDFVICALLVFVVMRFVKVPGWTFAIYMISYAILRAFLSEYRLDEQTIDGVPVPQLVSIAIIGLAVIYAGVIRKYPGPITREWEARVYGPPDDEPAPPPPPARRTRTA